MRRIKKWLSLLSAGFLATAAGCSYPDGGTAFTVSVDPARASNINHGVFEGWGTTLCWWANRIGYSDTLSRQAAEAFCDPVNGLGLNILRYNIGGGDDPTHTHITRTDSMMPGFWKNPVVGEHEGDYAWDYDWDMDANQQQTVEHVEDRCADAAS